MKLLIVLGGCVLIVTYLYACAFVSVLTNG